MKVKQGVVCKCQISPLQHGHAWRSHAAGERYLAVLFLLGSISSLTVSVESHFEALSCYLMVSHFVNMLCDISPMTVAGVVLIHLLYVYRYIYI